MSLVRLARIYQDLDRFVPARWRLPLRYGTQSLLGALEAEIHVLPRILRNAAGTIALDVGANVGIYTYALYRLGLQVHAFEPQPRCAAVISAWAEGKDELIVHTAAVGASPGRLILNVPIVRGKAVPTRASFLPFDHQALQMYVPVVTLDSIGSQPVSFIKIDVEGYELEVLNGAEGLINRFHPVLLIEIDRSRVTFDRFSIVINLLRKKGYICHTVCEDGRLVVHDQPWDAPSYFYNFIFLHSEASQHYQLKTSK
jgi:FkbM family methyltransferase